MCIYIWTELSNRLLSISSACKRKWSWRWRLLINGAKIFGSCVVVFCIWKLLLFPSALFFFFCLVSFPRYCANWWSDPLPPIIFPREIARKIELYCMAKCNMGCKSALLPFQSCRAYSKGLWRVLIHQILLFAGRVLNADALSALAHGINVSLFKSSVVPRTSGVLWLSVFKYVNLKTRAPRLMSLLWQLEGEEGVVWELRTALVTDLRKERLGYHIGFFCYFLFSYLDWKNPLECKNPKLLKKVVWVRRNCTIAISS